MAREESIIYLALERENKKAIGFMQLYPSFSSVSLESLWILNDLFVVLEHRKRGVGKALIETAKELVQTRGSKGLILATAHDNYVGQKLYQASGFTFDNDFLHFFGNASNPF